MGSCISTKKLLGITDNLIETLNQIEDLLESDAIDDIEQAFNRIIELNSSQFTKHYNKKANNKIIKLTAKVIQSKADSIKKSPVSLI